jgi:hypothetical protein
MPTFEFSQIPDQPIEKIAKAASLDASRHRPVIDGQLPPVLRELEAVYVNFHNKERDRAQEKLTSLQKETDRNRGRSTPDYFAAEAKNEAVKFFNFDFEKQKKNISQVDSVLKKRNDALIVFMNYRGYSSLPTRADIVLWKIWLFAGLIFLTEALINGLLFMNVAGLLGALALTTSQSFINIGISFVVGSWVITSAFYHPNTLIRIVNFALFILYIVFILWLNLALGLFRQLNEYADGLSIDVFENVGFLQQAINPFAHLGDFAVSGAIVGLVGICFAGFSAFKGYFSDDPRPGFGAIYRGARDEHKRVQEAITSLQNGWLSETVLTRAAVEARSETSIEAAHEWSHSLNIIEKILVDWDGLIKSLEEAMKARINVYYQSFNSISSENYSAPDHFLFDEREAKKELVFKDAIQYHMDDSVRKGQLEKKEEELLSSRKEIYAEIEVISQSAKAFIEEIFREFPSSAIGIRS